MKPIFNRAPLNPNTLAALPVGAIRPEDWLLDQLQTQAEGFSGHLDEIWPDVGAECAWLGGEGDGWERAPYYLDGLIPLAWALNDDALKAKCMKYIEWMLASQREDGWFGPEKNTDMWPLMVALKALRSYFTASNDKRVLELMDKYFRYQYLHLAEHPLVNWGVARGGDNMELVLWMYNLTGQKYLLKLVKMLYAQTLDWANYFHTFPHTQPMSKTLRWERLQEALKEEMNEPLEGEKRPYFRTQYHLSHGVNVAMGLKTPGVVNLFKSGFKEQGGFKFGWPKLMKAHGTANGIFTCDEHLNGANPTQGTETCTVVEAMYSLEVLLAVSEYQPEYADILEKLAYNALPAAFTTDMSCHQYDQQVNQVKCSYERRKWYNNEDDSNCFGFSPNFGCCTANAHQGWPKFVQHLWYATIDGGLQAISYAPCTVRAVLEGVPVRMRVSGQYPFGQTVNIKMSVKQPVEFPLYLRVPFWARQPMIYLPGGEIMQVRAGDVACVRRKWQTGDEVRIELPAAPRVTRWYHQSGAVELGPLLMAYQPEEVWSKNDMGDWEINAEGAWNWALLKDEPMKVVWHTDQASAFGKNDAPVYVLAKACKVNWEMDGGNAGSMPMMPLVDPAKAEVIALVPFGGTGLRIGQFPIARIPVENSRNDSPDKALR